MLKEIIGKQNDKSNISEVFRSVNDVIKDPKTISNIFCKYFSEIGPKFAEHIPAPENSYDHYMKHPISNQSLFMSPTDPIEITRIIMSLKPKNSSGHDDISSKLLKTLNQSICIPMCTIINKSLQTGDVSRSMTIVKVIPKHESKDKTDVGNYRPINFLITFTIKNTRKNSSRKALQFLYASKIHCMKTSMDSDRSTAPLMR